MRLSDIMGHAGLAGYAEVGLLLFLAAFLLIAIRLLRPSAKREAEHMSRLPLEDGTPPASGPENLS